MKEGNIDNDSNNSNALTQENTIGFGDRLEKLGRRQYFPSVCAFYGFPLKKRSNWRVEKLADAQAIYPIDRGKFAQECLPFFCCSESRSRTRTFDTVYFFFDFFHPDCFFIVWFSHHGMTWERICTFRFYYPRKINKINSDSKIIGLWNFWAPRFPRILCCFCVSVRWTQYALDDIHLK